MSNFDSYMIDKFNAGKVKDRNGAKGWLFDDGEFRPLQSDAMKQLFNAGLVTQDEVDETARQSDIYVGEALAAYRANPPKIDPFELEATFGKGVEVVDVITGKTFGQ